MHPFSQFDVFRETYTLMALLSIYYVNNMLIKLLSLYTYVEYHIKNDNVSHKTKECSIVCEVLQELAYTSKPYTTRMIFSITSIVLFIALFLWGEASRSGIVLLFVFIAWIAVISSLKILLNQFVAKKMLLYLSILLAENQDLFLSRHIHRSLNLVKLGAVAMLSISIATGVWVYGIAQ